VSDRVIELPPEQEAIRAKCFHPMGTFVEFKKEEVEQSIPRRFEEIVRQYPDRVAVKTGNHTLTYGALNEIANRIARVILAHRGEGEEPVAFLLEHGAGLMAAILGILKAGKLYVSLDPAFPHTRTAYMLEDSEAKLLLTNTQHLPHGQRLAQGRQDIVNCDDIDARLDSGNLGLRISPETHALILYTSGSTGRPKGVLHNHRNILLETKNYTNDVRLCPDDSMALWHSFSYAKSNRNMYAALLNGALLASYDLAALGFAPLAQWMHANRITILDTLPTTFRRLCETVAPDATFPVLRLLRLGGEPIGRSDVKLFQRHFCSGCVLMHAIGPTETSTIRRYFINHEWRHSDNKVPLGYAVSSKKVVLLDETGRDVGAGQIGEIAVRSKYLALEYWRRPDLTQTAFISDPGGGGERLYLTGDLGVMRPDGCLIHMGRKDFQVKIRGYRIEVGEIEAALVGLAAIKAAVVHAQAQDAGEPRLVAYVVAAMDGNLLSRKSSPKSGREFYRSIRLASTTISST
jgi:amino acid adenylation domain-containing protein